jgi:predicted nucleic acid-binding protein
VTVTADTSVVVPSLLDWHEHHAVAQEAVEDVHRLPGHVLAAAFSVLTRLPHGLSLRPGDAAELLLEAFPGEPLALPPVGYPAVLRRLAAAGLRGGSVYDGLVAASAAHAEATLLTADARAAGTYRAVDVTFEVLTLP